MRFQAKSGIVKNQRTACLILPVYASGALPRVTSSVDSALDGMIASLVSSGDFKAEPGDTLLLRSPAGQPSQCILLVGCGERTKFDRSTYRRALNGAYAALAKTRREDALNALTAEAVKGTDAYRRARIAVEVWHTANYRFSAMKSDPGDATIHQQSIGLVTRAGQISQVRKGIRHGDAIGQGITAARDLANLPANVCTPSYLVQRARAIAKGNPRMTVQVLSEAEMTRLKMGALLSVTAGTDEPAKFIIVNFSGGAKSKQPVVLVGKGITFDSGGISLKPPPAMDEMKFDMCGAAAVLGVLQATAAAKVSQNLIGIIPTCENLPSGKATKPGDIVTSMSGQTVEILNTDAEGRLILCDALTYAQRFKPAVMIDVATLTGACLIALGRHRSGLLSNSDQLAGQLMRAGGSADDEAWRLPMGEPYMDQLKSNFADVANVGGREAGTVTAACFLSRFVGDTPWAHLDIAGTAWQTGSRKGSTGRPIPLLVEFLLNR
jgi:leucyl aminopeptidase